jgi:hypothetical protein
MAKVTILTVKAALAAAFPDVEFAYDVYGRGDRKGHRVQWTGGPSADEVKASIPNGIGQRGFKPGTQRGWGDLSVVKHVHRKQTEAEYAAWWADYQAERIAEEAARPALETARKAAAAVSRKASIERNKAAKAKLASAFPGVLFSVTKSSYGDRLHLDWTDGPSEENVRNVMGAEGFYFIRRESEETIARNREQAREAREQARKARLTPQQRAAEASPEQKLADRLKRRLEVSKARQIVTMRGIAKRLRREAQLSLPFSKLPFMRKSIDYIVFGGFEYKLAA